MTVDRNQIEESCLFFLRLKNGRRADVRERLVHLVNQGEVSDRNLDRAYAIIHNPEDVVGFLEHLAKANEILDWTRGFAKVGDDGLQIYGRLQDNPIRITYADDDSSFEGSDKRLRAITTIHFEKGQSFTGFIPEGSSFRECHQVRPESQEYEIVLPIKAIRSAIPEDLTTIHLYTSEGEYRIKVGYEDQPDIRRTAIVKAEEARKKESEELAKAT